RLLATGWAKDSKGYASPAKKMLELTYDCTGAAAGVAAKTYAAIEGCPTTDPQPMGGYSMNFRRLKDYTLSDKDALVQAITDWWSPLKNADLDTNLEFTDGSPLTSFANMAYEVTSKFACSVKNCPNIGKTLVMCQYNPPITDGEKIYEPGKRNHGCLGRHPDKDHPALHTVNKVEQAQVDASQFKLEKLKIHLDPYHRSRSIVGKSALRVKRGCIPQSTNQCFPWGNRMLESTRNNPANGACPDDE
ncbi:hypothetical protein ANCDUO_25374, partial [Ancylostoma duodenale]